MGLNGWRIKPLRDSPRISIMISAIGASFLIEKPGRLCLFDARPKAFPVPDFFASTFVLGDVHILYGEHNHSRGDGDHPGRTVVGHLPHQDGMAPWPPTSTPPA